MQIVARAVSILRDLSSDSGNWLPIKQWALPRICQLLKLEGGMHLSDPTCNSAHVVIDAATVVRNMAVLEEHCLIVHSNGGLPLLQILAEVLVNPQLRARLFPQSEEGLIHHVAAAGMSALGALMSSSPACRQAGVSLGLFTRMDAATGRRSFGPVLQIMQNLSAKMAGEAPPQDDRAAHIDAFKAAIGCVEIIAKDPQLRITLVDSEASMHAILQLPKIAEPSIRKKAMAIVLNVVRDGGSAAIVWNNIKAHGDINLAFELLAVGDQTIKAQACESIKALSTPAIPGQAPRVSAQELVKRGVGPTLLQIIADDAESALEARRVAAECLVIMTGDPASHESLAEAGNR